MLNKKTGITLIALVITIVVLVILAGVGINLSMGENGILGKTQNAVDKYKQAEVNEEELIAKISNSILSNRDDNEKIAQLEKRIEELEKGANPTGTIISFYGSTAPKGYIACDGTTYDLTQEENKKYKELAAPDLRGEFLRGTGTNSHANQGSGGTVRTHQDATIIPHMNSWTNGTDTQNFNVQLRDKYVSNYPSNEDIVFRSTGNTRWYLCSNLTLESQDQTNSTSKQIYAFSSRPTNTSVLYCIKT